MNDKPEAVRLGYISKPETEVVPVRVSYVHALCPKCGWRFEVYALNSVVMSYGGDYTHVCTSCGALALLKGKWPQLQYDEYHGPSCTKGQGEKT